MQASSQSVCSNCSKVFPSDRIDLHEAYCARNFRKCPQCPLFVDIHDLDSHQEETHRKAPCQYCKTDLLPQQLTTHLTECLRRPKPCQYCETDVQAVELNTHEAVCGARTRLCGTCQQPVMIKDLVGHETRCRQLPPLPVSRPPPIPGNPLTQAERNDRRPRPANQRERDISSNNIRHLHNIGGGGDRSLSTNKHAQRPNPSRKSKQVKYNAIISAEVLRPMVQILPISIQLAINNGKRENREPLKARNVQP